MPDRARCQVRYVRTCSLFIAALLGTLLASCSGRTSAANEPDQQEPIVGVVRVARKTLQRTLIVSSELVPFQQIDVFAKESGFVQKLNVDYGTHVRAGDIIAVLEIPELRIQLEEDKAEIKDANTQIDRAQEDFRRVRAQHDVAHLQFTRLNEVAKSRPGLVAQQEVDDQHGKDLAAEAQMAAASAEVASAESQLTRAQARLRRDQAVYSYSEITAPFSGVITNRYANLGTLVQSGTHSSTQAMPVVQLSQDDLFRLVIPVPESYVPYIRIGDPVDVRVPALNKSFPGRVARFSVDVEDSTRTMHTEVDVPNPSRVLVPGAYAEATLILEKRAEVIALPPEALNIQGEQGTIWVVDGSGGVHLRSVKTGLETPDDIEITSGVSEGELVAVGDRSGLRAGEKVRPKEIQLLRYKPDTTAPAGH